MPDHYVMRVLLIPASVFLSVIFGGSYGSGREVMEFISQYGPVGGLISVLVTFLTYWVILFLSFEIARLFRAYEYHAFTQRLLGRLWWLYEVVILVGLVIALAVVGTVAGAVTHDTFGVPAWSGTVLLLVVVIALTYFGRELIERSMMLSISALFLILIAMLYFVFAGSETDIGSAFAIHAVTYEGWKGALTYAVVGTGFLPLLLYCARGLRTRAECLVASGVAGLAAVIPALAFHLIFMTEFPGIKEQALPTYYLFEKVSPAWAMNLYIVILFVLICQTGVGVLQGFIERLDAWRESRFGAPMTPIGHGLTAGFMVLASLLLGGMGVVALILRGYTLLSICFVVVFTVPLLTRGLWLVARDKT